MVKKDKNENTATKERSETPPAPPEPPTPQKTATVTAPVMIAGRLGDVKSRVELNEQNQLSSEVAGELLDHYANFKIIGEVVSVSVEMTPIARIEDDEHFEARVGKHAEQLNVRRDDLITTRGQGTPEGKRDIIGRFVIVRGVA